MDEEIREKAKKKVQEKKSFYVVALIFAGTSVVLLALSMIIRGPAAFWLLLPILIFALVLGIIYLSIFGFPGSGILSREWEAEEMDREMDRLYRERRYSLPPADELSEEERLELKELERLKRKWEGEDGFV